MTRQSVWHATGVAVHRTKTKRDLATAKAVADLAEQGMVVLLPLTEHAAYDLVADAGDRFIRVQVKYRAAVRGRLQVTFRSSWADRHGTHVRPVDKESFDVLCIYCPDTGECYYASPHRHGGTVTLRVSDPSNNQAAGVIRAASCRRLADAIA